MRTSPKGLAGPPSLTQRNRSVDGCEVDGQRQLGVLETLRPVYEADAGIAADRRRAVVFVQECSLRCVRGADHGWKA